MAKPSPSPDYHACNNPAPSPHAYPPAGKIGKKTSPLPRTSNHSQIKPGPLTALARPSIPAISFE